ncbi:MAG: hypothetical protein R6X33_04535 [Candidatus Brocadiia bacterium]
MEHRSSSSAAADSKGRAGHRSPSPLPEAPTSRGDYDLWSMWCPLVGFLPVWLLYVPTTAGLLSPATYTALVISWWLVVLVAVAVKRVRDGWHWPGFSPGTAAASLLHLALFGGSYLVLLHVHQMPIGVLLMFHYIGTCGLLVFMRVLYVSKTEYARDCSQGE